MLVLLSKKPPRGTNYPRGEEERRMKLVIELWIDEASAYEEKKQVQRILANYLWAIEGAGDPLSVPLEDSNGKEVGRTAVYD